MGAGEGVVLRVRAQCCSVASTALTALVRGEGGITGGVGWPGGTCSSGDCSSPPPCHSGSWQTLAEPPPPKLENLSSGGGGGGERGPKWEADVRYTGALPLSNGPIKAQHAGLVGTPADLAAAESRISGSDDAKPSTT